MSKSKIAKIISTLGELTAQIQELRDVEQDKFDDKSERWQEGEKGEEAQAKIDTLNEAADSLETTANELNDLV
ncbi:MAG: hypothetical protein PHU06_06025 [Gallionella sp.]|nr:hypothetical protein [Gallionella sp.]MDD4958403.1 hypothetical protein [Gallionella sp.]